MTQCKQVRTRVNEVKIEKITDKHVAIYIVSGKEKKILNLKELTKELTFK